MADNTVDVRPTVAGGSMEANEVNGIASHAQTSPAPANDGEAPPTEARESNINQDPRHDTAVDDDRDASDVSPSIHTVRQRAPGQPSVASATPIRPQWLPVTLRWTYLCAVIATTAIILILVIALHVQSALHSGLGDDEGANITYFLTRFLPTVVAVAYVFSTSVLLDDVKRTEPFARSASRTGAPVTSVLFWTPGAWWSALSNSMPNRRRGHAFSSTMFCTSLVFIFGFLLLSPFSSTLLATEDVTFSQYRTFRQLSLSSRRPIQPTASSFTYFRTISNVLQNVTTSAWITERYAVLPFWPTDGVDESMGAFVGLAPETWRVNTLVMSTDLDCEPMSLAKRSLVPDPKSNDSVMPFIQFKSPSGCTLSMTMDNYTSATSIASWTGPSNLSDIGIESNSSGCNADEAMIFSTALFVGNDLYDSTVSPNTDVQANGLLCSARYHYANVTVAVSMGAGESIVQVDEQAYMRERTPMSEEFMDVDGLQALFLYSSDWTSRVFTGLRKITVLGPGALLAASYEFSAERLVQEQMLLSNATKLKQRFLGELMRDTFDSVLDSDEPRSQVSGELVSTRRRVVVVPPVAITLEIVLTINLILLLLALVSSRISRRPLQLAADPATSVALVHFAFAEPDTMHRLSEASITRPLALLAQMKDLCCRSTNNKLYLFDSGHSDARPAAKLSKTLKDRSSLPVALQLLPVICLFVSMLAVAVAISVLLGFSERRGLYQTAFVYQIDFKIGGMKLDAINPASVLTTLLAVCIALWWGSVDTNMRKLQPFLTLAKSPVKGLDGVALSYETSYMLCATIKAIKRRHWLLALVSCGAFHAELFTIALSALWSRQPSEKLMTTQVPVSLQIRQVPLLLTGHVNDVDDKSNTFASEVLMDSFSNQTTSWMYGGAIQLALNGSEPAWSSNGWSFAPIDLGVLTTKTMQNTGDDSSAVDDRGAPLPSSTLAALDTVGIRARLECTQFDSLSDTSSWTTKHDLTDSTYWNTSANPSSLKTGYELGTIACSDFAGMVGTEPFPLSWAFGNLCGTAGGMNVSTTFYVHPPQLSCCENRTGDSFGPASVGYWSPNGPPGIMFPQISEVYPFNVTVKWIHGIAQEGFMMSGNASAGYGYIVSGVGRLMWHEPPQMTALNCRPIIETANARVTVDTASHRVQKYALTSEPLPDANAWLDLFSTHYGENYVDNSSTDHPINVTISHGAYFLASLIGASDIPGLSYTMRTGYPDTESGQGQRFNFFYPGLNVDYMSYSMFSLVDSNPTALLDPNTMEQTAQKTFSTFFQHYASSSLSTGDGGWVFSRLDERLPADLTSVANRAWVDPPADPRAGETVSVQVVQPVQVLQMSRAAAALALAVLLWLMVSTAILAYVSRDYKARLRWRVETIADVLAMFASSGKFLALLRDRGPREMKYSPDAQAILADFTTESGAVRWGIELTKPALTTVATMSSSTTAASAAPTSPSSSASPTSAAEAQPPNSLELQRPSEPQSQSTASASSATRNRQSIPQLAINTNVATDDLQPPEQSRVSPVLHQQHDSHTDHAHREVASPITIAENSQQGQRPPDLEVSPVSPLSDDDNENVQDQSPLMERNSIQLGHLARRGGREGT